jgi:chitin disaccharide deacetylase
MKRIVLCADDYGQNTAISQAIIDLAAKNRLSATSCLSNSYYWLTHAKWLEPFKDKLDIGLHFNLTAEKPLYKEYDQPTPLSQLIIKAYLKQLKQSDIEIELNMQINQFVAGIGRLPDFIDGHQHIQQLPQIRDALFNVYEKRLRNTGCYLRCVNKSNALFRVRESGYIKAAIIQLCGASSFKMSSKARNIPHNSTFSGIYNFADSNRYAQLFPRFLNQSQENGIIMCHPGLMGSIGDDPIADARYHEYLYFSGDQFINDCAIQHVEIGRFK